MKKTFSLLFLLAFLIMSYSLAWPLAQNWKLVVRVKGTVENQLKSQGKWYTIWQSRMLKDGDRARTLANSRAKIRLADNSVVTLGQNTEVGIEQFKIKKKSRFAKIKLFFGKVRANVGRFTGKQSKFEVQTPNGVLAARGTNFLVEYNNTKTKGKPQTKLMVFSSAVDIIINGKVVKTVTAGNSAIIGNKGAITLNPAGFTIKAMMKAKVPDADLYKPAQESGTTSGGTPSTAAVPGDPYVTQGGSQPGSNPNMPSTPGGVQPPAAETGNVNIIIRP